MIDYSIYSNNELYAAFAFRNGIAGAQGIANIQDNQTDWLIRARYLLSNVTDEQIASLFETGSIVSHGLRFNHLSNGAASWIAGLLKRRSFIPQIAECMYREQNRFYLPVYCIALLLFEDSSLNKHFDNYLRKYPDSEQQLLIETCATVKNFRWNALGEDAKSRNIFNWFLKIAHYSKLLRAGIEVKETFAFQPELKTLLAETTIPEKWMKGLFQTEPICPPDEMKKIKSFFQVLEADIYFQLPESFIRSGFEHAFRFMPRSFPLLEQYSASLLLYSAESEEGKKVYLEACSIKSAYQEYEDESVFCWMKSTSD